MLFTTTLQWAMQKRKHEIENSAFGKLLIKNYSMSDVEMNYYCLPAPDWLCAKQFSCWKLWWRKLWLNMVRVYSVSWLNYHLQAASSAFLPFLPPNEFFFDKVRLAVRLRLFDQVVTPVVVVVVVVVGVAVVVVVVVFPFGHRTIRMSDLYRLDAVFPKMMRMIAGPPNFVEWNAPWHDGFEVWGSRAEKVALFRGVDPYGKYEMQQSCAFAWRSLTRICNPDEMWSVRCAVSWFSCSCTPE